MAGYPIEAVYIAAMVAIGILAYGLFASVSSFAVFLILSYIVQGRLCHVYCVKFWWYVLITGVQFRLFQEYHSFLHTLVVGFYLYIWGLEALLQLRIDQDRRRMNMQPVVRMVRRFRAHEAA